MLYEEICKRWKCVICLREKNVVELPQCLLYAYVAFETVVVHSQKGAHTQYTCADIRLRLHQTSAPHVLCVVILRIEMGHSQGRTTHTHTYIYTPPESEHILPV